MVRGLIIGGALALMAGLGWAQQDDTTSKKLSPEESFAKAKEYIEKQGDFFSAMPYLRPAADAGNAEAQTLLAEFLDYGEENIDAEKYFRMAVAQGNARAKLGLAVMHSAGDTAKQDLVEARRLVEESAAAEYQPAIKALAAAYISGGLGIGESDRNSAQALKWIRRAADQEDLVALRKLEEAHRSGLMGLSVDISKADEIRAKINQLTGVKAVEETGRRRRK